VIYWTDADEDYPDNDDGIPESQYPEYSFPFTPAKPVGSVFSMFDRTPNFGYFAIEDQ
jgi:hypothetical protein